MVRWRCPGAFNYPSADTCSVFSKEAFVVQDAVPREMKMGFRSTGEKKVFQGDYRTVAAHITQQLHFS